MAVVTEHSANGHPSGNGAAAVPPVPFDHEDLVIRRGRRSGTYAMVAIHSTALGPALGGVRMWHYEATIDGARDALRLARGMTYKAAAAGLELGGGKGVVCAPDGPPPAGPERRAMLLDFADLVESLEGRYITAEDVGLSPDDLVVMSERTENLTGPPPSHGGSGDPSPLTALGVEAAMRACGRERFGSPDLAGRVVAVVGLGHVGERLARRLAADGAELLLSDIDDRKRGLAAELGGRWVDPLEAMLAECDVLAPCALGGAIDESNAKLLRCEVVCGSANNQLAVDGLDGTLAERGILYAPDFIVNAGGLIHVYREIRGYSEEHARELALGIEDTMDDVLEAAADRSITPLRSAFALARERLEAARLDDGIPDVVLLLEHPPVYTKGRRTTSDELPMGEDWYRMQGIEVTDTDRGGRVTYHGPGQLVGYPIVSLRAYGDDVHDYIRRMERVMIESLAEWGVEAECIEGLTGVWAKDRKIGSIGVHVNRGVTTHGFAINVNNDFQPFEWIVPRGIAACRMTSLTRELGAEQDMGAFMDTIARVFGELYEREPLEVEASELTPGPQPVA